MTKLNHCPRTVRRGLFILLWSSVILGISIEYASAAWAAREFRPDEVPSVSIEVDDQATGGCWTNMSEAARYAAEKMRSLGFNVVNEGWAQLEISVNSARPSSTCYGSVNISVGQYAFVNGIFGYTEFAGAGGIFVGHRNSNHYVFELIDAVIDEIKNQSSAGQPRKEREL